MASAQHGAARVLLEATLLQMLHCGAAAICCFFIGRALKTVIGGVDFLRAKLAKTYGFLWKMEYLADMVVATS